VAAFSVRNSPSDKGKSIRQLPIGLAIYSNAIFLLAAAAEQCGSFLYGRRTKSIDRARLVELVFPARPVTARLAGSVLDNTSIQLSYKLVSDFHDFS